jgi:hypothetical protein
VQYTLPTKTASHTLAQAAASQMLLSKLHLFAQKLTEIRFHGSSASFVLWIQPLFVDRNREAFPSTIQG